MTELLSSGIELMLVGMGIVYAFLGMLIAAIYGMGWVIARFFHEPTLETAPAKGVIDPKCIAAISAAVHQYRAKDK